MELETILTLQGMLFLLVAAGVILTRFNILPQEGTKILTDLVINLILPCNIIYSFQMELNLNILRGILIIFTISVLIQVGCMLLSKFMYQKQPPARRKVLQYGTVCSNAGFMGNPITEGVFGAQGLVYASIFLIPQRIVMWSAGISYFTGEQDRKKTMIKVLTHPCIFAVYIGLILMILPITLPAFVNKTISTISSCTTAMSMILIGTILANVNIKTIISKAVLYFTAIRLVLIPFLVYIGCVLFHVEPIVRGVAVLLAGMPAGSTTAILSAKYNGDYVFGTKCVVFTTLMSMITIPIWCMII